jgi:hypothetical protein
MEMRARVHGQLDANPEQEMATAGDTYGEFTQSKHAFGWILYPPGMENQGISPVVTANHSEFESEQN